MDVDLAPLVDAIRERRALLFAGDGISRNLGLPDFSCLVEHILREIGLAPEAGFRVEDYPIIAEAYLVQQGKLGPLRSWMDSTWHPASIDVTRSEVHNLILDLDFPIIYTTNYDRWLENAYEARGKPFHKITSVADLARPHSMATEIIKFHGDFDDDDSIVLTEASYFERMSFETPLDLRLRSDSLARPILFAGYSLHDTNTRYLLYKLQQLWQTSAWARLRPPSYILVTEFSPQQEIVLRQRGVQPILLDGTDPGSATIGFLKELLSRVREGERKAPVAGRRRRRRLALSTSAAGRTQ